MQLRKRFTLILGALACCLTGCYSVRTAYHFTSTYNTRRPVKDVLSDPNTPTKTKHKLKLLGEVLAFAKKEGLRVDSDTYAQYIDLQGKPVSYLLFVARADSFEQETWWFPFVGTVPYLGFFSPEERDKAAKPYADKGDDIHYGTASAFSLLGWLPDPVFSTMLESQDFQFARTLFHELTHLTLWLPGKAEANENFATFTSDVLIRQFLKAKGKSKDIGKLEAYESDHRAYVQWIKKMRDSLKELYTQSTNRNSTLSQKKNLIKRYTTQERPSFKHYNFVGKRPWNNARILASSLYIPDTQQFESAYACSGLRRIGDFVRSLESKLDDHELSAALDSYCSGRDHGTHTPEH